MKWLEGLAYVATIVAAITAIVTLSFGYRQFQETQVAQRDTIQLQRQALDFERESRTVELFNEYTKLMQSVATKTPEENAKSALWVGNTALFLAETIYKFNDGWHDTVKLMLEGHKDYIITERLDCHTYIDKFITFTKAAIREDICKTN